MDKKPNILFFNQVDKHSLPDVGGKGANLGEMTQSGFPVPNGFAVTVAAYDLFIKENDLGDWISDALKSVDVENPTQLQDVAHKIQKKISRS